MEGAVYIAGFFTVLMVGAIFYYLAHESTYAFDRKFDFGFKFAAQPSASYPGAFERNIAFDPNASYLTANKEGQDGVDEKEETAPMATLATLTGFSPMATAVAQSPDLAKVTEAEIYRDNWREQKRTDQPSRFYIYVFATPEYKEQTMRLAWMADEQPFDAKKSPFNYRLKMVQSPEAAKGITVDIDLKKLSKGDVELPTYVAATDADRTKGYIFEFSAESSTPNAVAVASSLLDDSWNPTGAYPRYGFMPLLWGSLFITLIAMILATPVAVACSVFLSEIAPSKVREWLKPIIEILASVPTVVLGYFGLLLVAPGIFSLFKGVIPLDNGRTLLTAAVVLAVLLLPVITSFAEDALRNIPDNLRDASDALGFTAKEKLQQVILPAARPGIIAAVLMGFARAIGETMIIWILSGASDSNPSFASPQAFAKYIVGGVRGTPDTIATDMGNVSFEGVHYGHLFLLGLILFAITLTINLIGFRLSRKAAWRS